MYHLRILLCISFLGLSPFFVKSQEGSKLLSIRDAEDSLLSLMKQIYSDNPISSKEIANNNFIVLLKSTLVKNDAFDYPFDSLKHIGKIKSEDKKVRIFSWNFPQQGGYQKYYGFILLKKAKDEVQLFELTDNRKAIVNPIKDILGAENWMGAIYYTIVDITYKEQTHYVLLGLDFNNLFSSKKIIDVLTFGKDKKPIFGATIFKVDNVALSRVVFEFSARSNMMLRYIYENKTIVFDHLSPSRPDFAENYQFYGSDFTYDGFKFEKGNWIYVRNLDLRNSKREPVKPRESPEKFPDPGFLYKSKGVVIIQEGK